MTMLALLTLTSCGTADRTPKKKEPAAKQTTTPPSVVVAGDDANAYTVAVAPDYEALAQEAFRVWAIVEQDRRRREGPNRLALLEERLKKANKEIDRLRWLNEIKFKTVYLLPCPSVGEQWAIVEQTAEYTIVKCVISPVAEEPKP
jgi:hypothetical protein